jgi:hypothetical protein
MRLGKSIAIIVITCHLFLPFFLVFVVSLGVGLGCLSNPNKQMPMPKIQTNDPSPPHTTH